MGCPAFPTGEHPVARRVTGAKRTTTQQIRFPDQREAVATFPAAEKFPFTTFLVSDATLPIHFLLT
ncbi:hypothetical protein [Spirosoma daeguense]